MANYVLVYHGGVMDPTTVTQEERDAEMAKWGVWYEELGAAVVDGGAPFMHHKTIAADGSVSDGGGANPATGYTIVAADDIDGAIALAKGCPILDTADGSIEVAQAIDMTPAE